MKPSAITLILILSALFNLQAGGEDWLTDYEEALALARKENKFVLMDFTGSDWCPPCQLINREIYAKAEFKDFAARNLVLLEIDFPLRKRQTEEQIAANEALKEKYAQEIYPTNILLNSEGKEIHRATMGFSDMSAAEYVAHLKKIIRRD